MCNKDHFKVINNLKMKKHLLLIFTFCLSIISIDLAAQNNVEVTAFYDYEGNGLDDNGLIVGGLTTGELFLTQVGTGMMFNHDSEAGGAGLYTFDVPDGDYFLTYIETAWTQAATVAGSEVYAITLFTADNDVDPLSGVSGNFSVAGATVTDIDLGLYIATAIGDFVWEDTNGDGLSDGEPGLANVNVTLLDGLGGAALDTDMNPVPATMSDGTGAYTFGNLPPGEYIVQFSLPTEGGLDWRATTYGNNPPNDFINDSDADPNNSLQSMTYTNFLNGNQYILYGDNIDAGFFVVAKIGNMVFCDENGNGIDDDGVGGVDGIEVRLIDNNTGVTAIDADGNNHPILTTMGGGMYEFELVTPGDYIVEFSFPGGGGPSDPPFVFTLQDQGGNDDLDSDVNPMPGGTQGQTPIIEVSSRDVDEETMWDAGVYQVINIFGTIWLEDDMNNMYDGEMGPGGVFLEIFNADDDSKVDDAFTNAGEYEFIGLAPGNYYIAYNVAGTSLESATPCPGSNDAGDMVDNDDNGIDAPLVQTTDFTLLSNCDPNMPPEVFYIDFCYFFDCNEPNLLAATACDDVLDPAVICDISILGTFCNLMPTQDSPGNQPNPLCSDGGAPHNISWFAFVAYGGSYSITVTPTGCSGSTTQVEGVQIGLYTDCTFTESVYCNPDCNTDPVTFNSDGTGPGQDGPLEEGQTYYFFIDGCSSSVCSYEVDITGNPIPPNLVPQDVCIDNNGTLECMDATYCPDAAVDFVATDFDLTVDFTWSVTTVSGTTYTGDPAPMSTEEILSITFPDEGVYEICLTQVDNGCAAQQWNGNICRQVTIEGIDDEMFDLITVCNESDFTDISLLENMGAANPMDPNGDGTIGWQGPTNGFTEGTNMFEVTTSLGCVYEQEFELELFPESDEGLFEMTLCKDELPINVDAIQITEISFAGNLTFSLQDILLVNEQDVNGCDSTIDISLEVLDVFMGELGTDICLPEGIPLELDFNTGLSTGAEFMTFEWSDPNGNPLPDNYDGPNVPPAQDNIAPSGINGIYTCDVTVTKNGKTCMFSYTVDINFDDLLPPTPTITGPPLEICESESIQTYTATDFGDAFNFTWNVPDTDNITAGGQLNDETITYDWAGSNGGTISLVTVNGCGDSELVDVTVTLVPLLTPSFDATAEVCVGLDATIMFLGDQTDVDSYTWNFDGGTITNATGGTGPGPHEITWADAGDKTVTLSVMHNGGCVSTETPATITVISPPEPPAINCVSQLGEVTFNWDLITGTVEGDYSVDITTGQSGTLNGTSYTITGLAVNEQVDITLTILTNDACVEISTTSFCIAQNCTPPTVSISAPGDVVDFCLNGTDQTFNLVENIPTGVTGAGTFTGDGITDMATGTFDPSAASVGPNTINYSYLTDDGCTAAAQIVINIFETPMADFDTDVDTICISDQFQLTYTGTGGVSVINWDTGDGQTINGQNPTVSFATAGPHVITLDVEKDGCPSTEVTKTVFVQPEFEELVISCSQQSIDLVEFSWNAVAGATGYEVTITFADGSMGTPFTTTATSHMETGLNPMDVIGISIVVLTDSTNRCSPPSDDQTCEAIACPTFTFMYDSPVTEECVDGTNTPIPLQAIASGGIGDGTYTWSGSGNIINDNQFDPNGLPEGQVTLFVEYVEGGCGESGSVVVNITHAPTASFDVAPDAICVGSTLPITYTGSQLANQVIDWSISDVSVNNVSGNDYEATFNDVGTFDIVLSVTNGNICDPATMTTTITVEPELVFDEIDCAETLDQITFSWTDVDCATEYEVFIGGVSQGIQTTTTYTATGLIEGEEIQIEVIAVSGCACGNQMQTKMCEAKACTPVTLALSSMSGLQEFCMSPDLTPVQVLADPIGTQGTGSGTWSGTGVDSDGMFDPMVAGVGTHVITYDWVESEGCPFSETITFEVFETPTVTAAFDPIDCYDETSTTLTVDPQGGAGSYAITLNGDDAMLVNDVLAGNYNIIVTDENMCTDETSVNITVPAEPMPDITGSTELIVGETSNYSINSALFTGQAIDSIVWTANGVIVCNTVDCFSLSNEAPIVTTTYVVTVFYNDGCSVTRTIVVDVTEPEPVSIVTFPNIISPNNDGSNDEWSIFTNDEEVMVNSVNIYDRWGDLVFSESEPFKPADKPTLWDGKIAGSKELQPGVYVYFVEFFQDGRDRIRSGDITIIK